MSNIKLKYIKPLLIASALLLSVSTASANVGKVVYGYGTNYALDIDGNRRDLSRGDEIREGDTLVTGRGRMHIRLIDGGFVSVYPNSEYKIDKFKFSGRTSEKKNNGAPASDGDKKVKPTVESKEDRGFFSLLKGAARQVTGLLGRTYNENFKFKSAVATIGIRGTGFFARLCQADCFDADGNPMQDGMYVKNNTGVITMTTNAGDVALAQGQSAFAASSEDSPHQVVQPPVPYNIVTPDIQQFDFDEKVLDPALNAEIVELTPVEPPVTPPVTPPVSPPSVVVNNLEYITMTSRSFAEPLNGFDTAAANSSVQQNSDTIEHFETEVFTDALEPVVFDKAAGTLAESGTNATLGVIWNRWSGGYTHTQSGMAVATLDNNLHMIGSTTLTQNLPPSGTINYTGTGGTSPTFAGATGNQVGTQTVSAMIDYGVMEVFTLDITATFSDATVNASLANTSGNNFIGAGGNIYSMNANCTGAGCGGNGGFLTGSASVNMVGPNAGGIYGIYSLTSGSGDNALSGSYLATDPAQIPQL
ncbi:MAG TPA: hypothetical protein ENJ87_04185, partial [Gammaproteobacteria bacterium]|nr:hypothetical protein [Gammaproteobacteria bacterium]